MHTEPRGSRAMDRSRLERAIVLQLLREDRERRWSPAELETEIDAEAHEVEGALRRLSMDGVLCLTEEAVWASPAALRLDGLGLISV